MSSNSMPTLFGLLRKILKQRGITYASLAQSLDVSELTIKRIFRDADCKLSRLMEICDAVGIELAELTALLDQPAKSANYLPEKTEAALARDPALFNFLVLLISRFDAAFLEKRFRLAQHQVYLYLRSLERLDILQLGQGYNFRWKIELPVRWRLDGPLAETIIHANQTFIALCLGDHLEDVEVAVQSRLISDASMEVLQEKLRNLSTEFNKRAHQDQLLLTASELKPVKFLAALAPFPVEELFPLQAQSQTSATGRVASIRRDTASMRENPSSPSSSSSSSEGVESSTRT